MGQVRIGVSGWSYKGWRGSFYPDDLAHSRELDYAVEAFDTIEINGTFYRLTSPETCERWYRAAPADFVYAVKGSRFITHNKKLASGDSALSNFFAAGVLELADKLGPILWQLSGRLRFNPERVEAFFDHLPYDTEEAADLARSHDERIKKPSFGPGGKHRLRHVLEVRHESFLTDKMVDLARSHRIALAFSHSSQWPYLEEVTTDLVYVRLHGPERLYDSAYGDGLAEWATRVEAWQDGEQPPDAQRITQRHPPQAGQRDVYVYFDNDGHAYAPKEALALRDLLAAR